MVPLTETLEQTRARLLPLAHQELAEAFAAGGVAATAVDGSLGSGKLWPSSDLDLTVVPEGDGPEWGVQWRVRNGLVVHKHLNRWTLLERLRRDFPQSFIDTAAGNWVRDPTWLLDGLAVLRPVHDSDGRLQAFADWMHAHRFAPEVVAGRRPLLLRRAQSQRDRAADAFASGDTTQAASHLELATEALALIYLEADQRIVSSKLIDPELAHACDNLGFHTGTHVLFRQTVGVSGLTSTDLAIICAAFAHLLRAFSDWLDPLVSAYPTGHPQRDLALARLAYYRHHAWSALYAPEHGCLLHLAAMRQFVQQISLADLSKYAADSLATDADAGARLLSDAGITAARDDLLNTFVLPDPPAARLAALDELLRRTHAHLAVPGEP